MSKLKSYGMTALTSGLIALLICLVWYGAVSIIGIDVEIQAPGSDKTEPLPIPAIVFATLIPALAGTGLAMVLKRMTGRGLLIFQIVAGVVLVLSLGSPLGLPVDTVNKLVLVAMHFIAAGAVVWAVRRNYASL